MNIVLIKQRERICRLRLRVGLTTNDAANEAELGFELANSQAAPRFWVVPPIIFGTPCLIGHLFT